MNAGGHGSDMAATLRRSAWSTCRTARMEGWPSAQPSSSATGAPSLGRRTGRGGGRAGPGRRATAPRPRPRSPRSCAGAARNQPGGANAGSVFTNPPGDSAGRLIDAAGAKGLRIGTAEVSAKHANFIQADRGRVGRRRARPDGRGAPVGCEALAASTCAPRPAWSASRRGRPGGGRPSYRSARQPSIRGRGLSPGTAERPIGPVDPRIEARRRSVGPRPAAAAAPPRLRVAVVLVLVAAAWFVTRTSLLDVDQSRSRPGPTTTVDDVLAASGVEAGRPAARPRRRHRGQPGRGAALGRHRRVGASARRPRPDRGHRAQSGGHRGRRRRHGHARRRRRSGPRAGAGRRRRGWRR